MIKGILFGVWDLLQNSFDCFHMTSRRPYWCPKTMKRRPCLCPKLVLWELNSFLSYANAFFCSNKLEQMLATWVKTLYKSKLTYLTWCSIPTHQHWSNDILSRNEKMISVDSFSLVLLKENVDRKVTLATWGIYYDICL